ISPLPLLLTFVPPGSDGRPAACTRPRSVATGARASTSGPAASVHERAYSHSAARRSASSPAVESTIAVLISSSDEPSAAICSIACLTPCNLLFPRKLPSPVRRAPLPPPAPGSLTNPVAPRPPPRCSARSPRGSPSSASPIPSGTAPRRSSRARSPRVTCSAPSRLRLGARGTGGLADRLGSVRSFRAVGGAAAFVVATTAADSIRALGALGRPLGIAAVGQKRGDDPDHEQARDDEQTRKRRDLHEALDQELDRHEREHDGHRLVEVAETAYEPVDEHEQRSQPEQRENVPHPDEVGVAGDRERRRDRVDSEGEVGEDDRDQAEEDGRRVAAAAHVDEPPAAVIARLDGIDAAHEPDERVALGVEAALDAAKHPVGEPQQRHPEGVEQDLELVDERDAPEDGQTAHDESGRDPPEEQPGAVLAGHAEVAEEHEEDDEVVERERALDDVDGRVDEGVRAPGGQPQEGGGGERHTDPADRPDRRLTEARLAPAREEPQVEPQKDDQRDGEREPGD